MNLNDIIIIGLGKAAEIKNKIYSIDEVYNAIKNKLFPSLEQKKSKTNPTKSPHRVMFDGDMVKANSQRLQLFYTKGFKCTCCGIEGKFFIKIKTAPEEKHYHLELIGLTQDNRYVVMTKDHIVPKARGGKDELENYQTMCCLCNSKKADDPDEYAKGDLEGLKKANELLFDENKSLKKKIIKLEKELEKHKNKKKGVIKKNRKTL